MLVKQDVGSMERHCICKCCPASAPFGGYARQHGRTRGIFTRGRFARPMLCERRWFETMCVTLLLCLLSQDIATYTFVLLQRHCSTVNHLCKWPSRCIVTMGTLAACCSGDHAPTKVLWLNIGLAAAVDRGNILGALSRAVNSCPHCLAVKL